MMMNEAEARTKWCPLARTGGSIRPGAVPAGDAPDRKADLCIASDCMAWRQTRLRYSHASSMNDATHGFCGLAGVPSAE